jgi:hypothetical protein
MKMKGWVTAALLVGGIVFASRGCLGCLGAEAAPDQRLVKHFDELCEIARHHVETPAKGVRKLGRYMGKHLEHMLGDFGATIAMIEKIADDGKHDARARTAHERLARSLQACEADWSEFDEAVEHDPEARALVERAAMRLSRTLEILFGGDGERFDLGALPRRLERALEPIAAP